MGALEGYGDFSNTEKLNYVKGELEVNDRVSGVVTGDEYCIDSRLAEGMIQNGVPTNAGGPNSLVIAMLIELDNSNISDEKIVQILDELYPNGIYNHTDEHNHESCTGEGCGYLTVMRENLKEAGIGSRVIKLLEPKLKEFNKKNRKEVLLGEHEENAILINKDALITVSGTGNKEDNLKVFSVDKGFQDKKVKRLSNKLSEVLGKTQKEIEENINNTLNSQLGLTTSKLAPNMDIFELGDKTEKGKNHLTLAGKVGGKELNLGLGKKYNKDGSIEDVNYDGIKYDESGKDSHYQKGAMSAVDALDLKV